MNTIKVIIQQLIDRLSDLVKPVIIKGGAFPALILILTLFVNNTTASQSPVFKVRALWVDPSGFGTAEAVDQMISRCRRAGINTILPDIMVHGTVYFKSSHFLGKVSADNDFDPLAYMVKKAHAAGIKIQAWSCVYYEGRGTPRNPEWVSQSFDRNPQEQIFLSPAHPDVNPYLLSVLKDLLKYDIDGIHLDYSRYCNAAFDYSDGARNRCKSELGFDPLNFLDHPELIVPAENDNFPVRVLHPETQIKKVWEIGAVERNMNRTGAGFAFVSENPKNIDDLHIPGLLIISHYTDVNPKMAIAIKKYVDRGGDLLWIEATNTTLSKSPELQNITGLKGAKWLPQSRVSFKKEGDHPVGQMIPSNILNTSGSMPIPVDAHIIARLNTGEPAITINKVGKGKVMVIGFRAMESNADPVILLLRNIIDWFRAEAGVKGTDILGEKRNQWINWRESHVTSLVRDFNKAAKEKNPNLLVTSSAGVGPQQLNGTYRDGAHWLTENINDALFPMNYTPDPTELEDMLEEQGNYIPQGKQNSVFPGLQLYIVKDKVVMSLGADIVEKELLLVRQKGYHGFCLFAYNSLSDEIIDMLRKYSK
jgi:uncharacterized lipoprotein YddW (UPF0748 family)